MKLPKIEYPIYTITLPISKRKVSFRPFTLGEQKVMMISSDASDKMSVFDAICRMVDVCCAPSEKPVSSSDLCQTDLEILFLNIRARSAGELLHPTFRCENTTKKVKEDGTEVEEKCNGVVPMEIDLLNIHLSEPKVSDEDVRKGMIRVSDNIIIKMKPTSAKQLLAYESTSEDKYRLVDLIKNSIESVFDGDGNEYDEFTDSELTEWIMTIPSDTINRMLEYISSIPRIDHTITGKCVKCGKLHKYRVTNFYDFFRF